MTVLLLVAMAGGLGAVARFVLDGLISAARPSGAYPVGIAVINLSGSFGLGLVAGLALGHGLTAEWQLVVGTGFLGGYTTFSTASYHTVGLMQERRPLAALLNGLGMLVLSVGLAGLGLWLGSR